MAYYVIFAIFIFWLGSTVEVLKYQRIGNLREWLLKNQLFFWVPLLLAVVLFVSVPPYFRILSDETNLVSVSKSMLYDHGVNLITMGKWYDFNFHAINFEFEKRPLLFPFLVHLIHLVRGYHAENVFVANFLILLAMLMTLFKLSTKAFGILGGIAILLLIVSQPILAQTASSAGFDLLAVFFLILSYVALNQFLLSPSAISFGWLWLTLLMLCQTRHESIAVFFIAMLVLLLAKKIKIAYFSGIRLLMYSLTPLFLIVRVWQYYIRARLSNPYEIAEGASAFSLQNGWLHAIDFLKTFLRFDLYLPFATIVNWIGAISFLIFLIQFFRDSHQSHEKRLLFIISALSVVMITGVLLAFHVGDVTHPISSRYFLLIFILLSFFAGWGLQQIKFFKQYPYLLIAAALTFLAMYYPIGIKNNFFNTLTLSRKFRTELGYFKKLNTNEILIIDDRPGHFSVFNYGSVNFEYANHHAEELLKELQRRLYRDIYVIQDFSIKGNVPTKETEISAGFQLETDFEFIIDQDSFCRISKVQHSASALERL